MPDKPIRVLQILSDFKKGGTQGEVIWPARILDPADVRFDVLLTTNTKGFYEEEFLQYGEIYRIPLERKKTKIGRALSLFIRHFTIKRKMMEILKSHGPYDAVHSHSMTYNAAYMAAAKKSGVPVRIAYCAVNKPEGKQKDRLHFRIFLWLCSIALSKSATHRFGVTQNAADYAFGRGKGVPIKNPTVDFALFDRNRFDGEPDGRIHMLMVGSFSSRKNQKFAIEVLRGLNQSEAIADITFIGYPRSDRETYLAEMKQMIADYRLEEYVSVLPQDSDIPKAMAEASCLLIPSLQEGLPNVALEAQKMGLPCFVSTDVSDDCDCGGCTFLPLDEGVSVWRNEITGYFAKNGFAKLNIDMSEWDNRKVCKDYLELWRGNK